MRHLFFKRLFCLVLCFVYLVACTATDGEPAPGDGALLGSVAGREDKADGPDAVADWKISKVGGDTISLLGVDEGGAYVAHFLFRPVDLRDELGEVVASGLSVTATAPEHGYREINLQGQIQMDTMSPRLNGLLVQLLEDLNAKQLAEPGDGKGDLSESCTGSLVGLLVTVVSAALCPLTGLTCFVAVGAAAATGVAGLICLIGLAVD